MYRRRVRCLGGSITKSAQDHKSDIVLAMVWNASRQIQPTRADDGELTIRDLKSWTPMVLKSSHGISREGCPPHSRYVNPINEDTTFGWICEPQKGHGEGAAMHVSYRNSLYKLDPTSCHFPSCRSVQHMSLMSNAELTAQAIQHFPEPSA